MAALGSAAGSFSFLVASGAGARPVGGLVAAGLLTLVAAGLLRCGRLPVRAFADAGSGAAEVAGGASPVRGDERDCARSPAATR